MKVFICARPDEIGKFYGVVETFPDIWGGSILDVGCRSRNLKFVLSKYHHEIRYCGVDLHPPADIVSELEAGLPFSDQAFDVVVALDVLEHTNNIHKSFEELCRVARKFVVITLPNAYELKARLKILLGLPHSGKYGLPVDPPEDRHRWFFSLNEARVFVHDMAQRCRFRIVNESCLIGPRRAFAVGRVMAGLFPNLLSPWYVVVIRREGSAKT